MPLSRDIELISQRSGVPCQHARMPSCALSFSLSTFASIQPQGEERWSLLLSGVARCQLPFLLFKVSLFIEATSDLLFKNHFEMISLHSHDHFSVTDI